MTIQQEKYLKDCRTRYAADLTDDIMPFWMQHGLDREHGGVYTCVDRDGTLMDTTKSVWFQGRFGYVCASAYRHAGGNPEWLEASKSALEFIERHCIDTDGHMFFSVTAEGAPVQKRRYVFSECFAAIAMAEYAAASGDARWAEKAVEMFRNILRMLSTPGFLPPEDLCPCDRALDHDDPDQCGAGHQTGIRRSGARRADRPFDRPAAALLHAPRVRDAARDGLARRRVHRHLRRKNDQSGTLHGDGLVPARGARMRGWDAQLVKMAATIIDWAWKWGWDEPYGGMINFRDCRKFPPQDYSQDMKFWWPQCETILAGLYAYIATGDEKYLEMHRKAHDYAFGVFPDVEYGEWFGYLHRDGTVAQPAKGNLFKGPFHIPRMMINATRLCDEILNK